MRHGIDLALVIHCNKSPFSHPYITGVNDVGASGDEPVTRNSIASSHVGMPAVAIFTEIGPADAVASFARLFHNFCSCEKSRGRLRQ